MTVGVVVMAYGTPAARADVLPYYTDIRRGRPPTDEQLADLIRRYDAIGGLSPLRERTEAQRRGLQGALDAIDPGSYLTTVGTKHARPSIEAGVEHLVESGVERVVGLVLAPHDSALSVGQYLERAGAAAARAGRPFAGIRSWATEDAYVELLARNVTAALAGMPATTEVVFTAHSLPARVEAMGDPCPAEVAATAGAVAARLDLARWSTAWQSAGRTPEPWLGPDILAVLDDRAARAAVDGVLVCPCGFVADHLEVLYDLDIEARARAEAHGLAFGRTAVMNDDGDVLAALAERVRAA